MKKTILIVLSLSFTYFASAQNDNQPKTDPSLELNDFFDNYNFDQNLRIGEDNGLPENGYPYAYDLAKQRVTHKNGVISTDGIKYYMLIKEPKLENSVTIPNAPIDRSIQYHLLQQGINE